MTTPPNDASEAAAPEDAERARRRAFLRLPMSERLRRGVEFSRFALRNLGAARRRPKGARRRSTPRASWPR